MERHLSGAAAVIQYLEHFLKQVRKGPGRPKARYDIMAVTVDSVNRYLDRSPLLLLCDGDTPHVDMQTAQPASVYQLCTMLTEHQQSLNKTYCPVVLESMTTTSDGTEKELENGKEVQDQVQAPQVQGVISKSSTGASILTNAAGVDVYRFTCELFNYIPYLCERYVNGSFNEYNVQLVEGAAEHMQNHLDKVWRNLLANPTDFVHRHQDGYVYVYVYVYV